ncbi:MAG: hypothetical protein MRY67_06865 [Rhodovulum sp.]|nr:hypothetical protein [Rhodovulum sp.]
MKRLFLSMAFVISASQSLAETIAIRSGEHPTFSRLVIDFSGDVDWQEDRKDRQHSLTFTAPDLTLETRRVFSKIPRNRLSDLLWQDKTLTLDLACDCTVRTQRLASGKLVIDVTETPYVAPPVPPEPENTPQDLKSAREMFDRLTETPAAFPLRKAPEPAPGDVSKAAENLAQEIGRAASLGLLAPTPTGLDAIPTSTPTDNGLPGFELRNALDTHDVNPRDSDMGEATTCRPADAFDIAHWGGEEPAGELIGRARNKLVGEFDLHNADDVTAFARRLLYLGFGAEARSTLNALDGDPDPVLHALSFIVDGQTPLDETLLADQVGCDTAGALWAVLALKSVPEASHLNAILREFSALPDHHRVYLGPKLIRAFLESDLPEQAHQIRNAIDRSADESEPVHVVDAEIALHGTEADHGRDLLRDIALRDRHEAPEALDLLLHDPDVAVDPSLAKTAVVYAAESPKTDQANRLLSGAIAAFLADGDYPAAFDAVTGLRPDAQAQAFTEIWTHLIEQGADASFLQILYTPALAETRADWPDALTKDAHSRLSDLGFAEQADEFWPLIGHAAPSPKEVIATNKPTPAEQRPTATFNSDRAREILSQSSALSEKVEEILLN